MANARLSYPDQHALQLGAVFDCTSHTLSSRRLKVKAYGMRQSQGGHYIMNIEEFHVMQHVIEIPEDYKMPESCEAVIWDEGCQQDVCVAGFSADSSDSGSDAQVDGTHRASSLPGMRRLRSSDSRVSGFDQWRCNGGGRDGCMESDERDLHRAEVGRTKSPRGSEGHSERWIATRNAERRYCVQQQQRPGQRVEQGAWQRDVASSSAAWEVGSQEEITQYFDMESGEFLPTPEEMEMLKKKREKKVEQAAKSQAKRGEKAALTGEQANYPRGGSESGSQCEGEDVHVLVEEDVVAVEGKEGGGENISRSDLEEKSPLAGHPHGQGSGSPLGAYGSHEEADVDSQGLGADVTDEEVETVREEDWKTSPRADTTDEEGRALRPSCFGLGSGRGKVGDQIHGAGGLCRKGHTHFSSPDPGRLESI